MATGGWINMDIFSDETSEERCDRHSHKHIDMYCQYHDSVGCSTCMAVDHRACQDICYIPEFIHNNTNQAASTEIQTKLKEISKTLAEQVTNFKQDKQRLLKRKAELLAEIRKFRQEMNGQLDKLEKNSIDEVEFKVKHLEDKIEDNLKKLQANNARVTSAYDKLASPNTNQAEVFVHVKIGEDAAYVADECAAGNKRKSTGDDIEFQPDKTILTLLEKYKAIGTVTEVTRKTTGTLFQIKGKQSYCVTAQPDEKDSNIKSACCLKDGTIILAIRYKNKLKRFHSNNYTITDYPLPGAPLQVCSINAIQVAVTLPYEKEVHFIFVEGQMSTTNKIKTGFECYGLAYTNNNLYVSDCDTEVYIYTLSGRKLKQFRIRQHSLITKFNALLLRSNLCTLAVSEDATRIYVADTVHGLIVLDNNGKVITTFNGEKLNGASSCCVTEAGSVLVSSAYNNNHSVFQFTCDGKLIGEIIKSDNRKMISSLCCNQQMSKLYVSRESNNNIEVYDI